jgi:esterase/lipase
MKKLIKKNKISLITAYIILLFGFFCILFLVYRTIYRSKDSIQRKKMKALSLSRKIMVKHDYKWYKKQKKYLKDAQLRPITFSAIKSDNEKDKTVVRKGWLLVKKNATATILVCHGFMTSKEDMSLMRYILSDYNVMTFDFRAHGENPDGQCCTFGQDEKNDVIGAVDFIKKHKELSDKPIIVYGFSMGAVASIMAQRERPDLFNGAIWDCPFDSSNDLIIRALDRAKISIFGFEFNVPGILMIKRYVYHPYIQYLMKLLLKLFVTNFDATQISTFIKPISPKEAIRDIKIPIFLIACHNDDKAPPLAVTEIYNNCKSPFKRLWISMGRRHFDAFFINPEKYIYKMKHFINMVINQEYLSKKNEKIKEDPWLFEMSNNKNK